MQRTSSSYPSPLPEHPRPLQTPQVSVQRLRGVTHMFLLSKAHHRDPPHRRSTFQLKPVTRICSASHRRGTFPYRRSNFTTATHFMLARPIDSSTGSPPTPHSLQTIAPSPERTPSAGPCAPDWIDIPTRSPVPEGPPWLGISSGWATQRTDPQQPIGIEVEIEIVPHRVKRPIELHLCSELHGRQLTAPSQNSVSNDTIKSCS